MVSKVTFLVTGLLGLPAAADSSTYGQNAVCANDQLMRLYDQSTGLWPFPGSDLGIYWWQAANMLTAFNDLALLNGDLKQHYSYVWDDTYNNAPAHNPSPEAVMGADGQLHKVYRKNTTKKVHVMTEVGDFKNDFYDDEAWWALAWLGAVDNTGDDRFRQEAIAIWYDMKAAWGRHQCGGVPWNKSEGSSPVAISNELYIALGASLANHVGDDQKPTYLAGAQEAWEWFRNSGMINGDSLINDGLDPSTCQNDGKPTYSYNQGVILGGLVELYWATGDASYLDSAGAIADAVTRPGSSMLDGSGILVDDCDRTQSCGGDGIQFKGVFNRNLRKLQEARPTDQWKAFLETNAKSIWDKDLSVVDGECRVGVYWGGPYAEADASSQSSGLDALTAAFAVTGQ